MNQNIKNINWHRTLSFTLVFLTLSYALVMIIQFKPELQVNGQTLQEKCSPDSGINISKSNCFSNEPTSIGKNITGNETFKQ